MASQDPLLKVELSKVKNPHERGESHMFWCPILGKWNRTCGQCTLPGKQALLHHSQIFWENPSKLMRLFAWHQKSCLRLEHQFQLVLPNELLIQSLKQHLS